MDKIKLQILAGVPITVDKDERVIESITDRSLARTLKSLIRDLDGAVSGSTNRENKSEFNDGASDLEDILAIVKTGKQKKAGKLYSELTPKIKSFITSKLDAVKAEKFKKYFQPVNEGLSGEYEEEMAAQPEEQMSVQPEENTETEEMVECPFCSCGSDIPKIGFYDHIMDNHVEMPDESPESSEFDINLGTISDEGSPQMEAEDATVWDKTEDKNESPSGYPIDGDKISLPKEIKSALEKEIKALQKSSEELVTSDYETAEFQNNTANAMIDVLYHLKDETETGMKKAQVTLTKQQSPIIQKFPDDVYKFIIYGGADTKKNTTNSLVSLFKEIKDTK